MQQSAHKSFLYDINSLSIHSPALPCVLNYPIYSVSTILKRHNKDRLRQIIKFKRAQTGAVMQIH